MRGTSSGQRGRDSGHTRNHRASLRSAAMSKRAFVEATSNKPLPAHVRSIGSLTAEPLPSGTKIRVAGRSVASRRVGMSPSQRLLTSFPGPLPFRRSLRLVYYHDEAGLLLLVAHDGARGLWVDPSLCFEPPYGAIHDHSEGTMWMAMGELEIVGVSRQVAFLPPPSYLPYGYTECGLTEWLSRRVDVPLSLSRLAAPCCPPDPT